MRWILLGNQTWEITELSVGKKALHNRWINRLKTEQEAWQKRAIDYSEVFSPVVKITTISLVLRIVAIENLYLEQLVKIAFLHGDYY